MPTIITTDDAGSIGKVAHKRTLATKALMGVVAAATAAGSLVGIDLATAASAWAKDATTPLSVTFSGSASMPSPSAADFAGSGSGTPTGHVSYQAHAVILGPASSCANGFSNVNTATLTTASGSTLTLRSTDTGCPSGGPGQYHCTGLWKVVGGTGAYRNADGSGQTVLDMDFAAGTVSGTFTGSVKLSS